MFSNEEAAAIDDMRDMATAARERQNTSAGAEPMPANVIEAIIAAIVGKWSGTLPASAEEHMRSQGWWDDIFCLGNQFIAALGVLESAGCVRKPGAAEMTDDEKRKLIEIAKQMCAADGAAAQSGVVAP